MHKGETVKILDCNNGQLVIHYNLALANSLCVLSDKINQIGEDVCKYIQAAADGRGYAQKYSGQGEHSN